MKVRVVSVMIHCDTIAYKHLREQEQESGTYPLSQHPRTTTKTTPKTHLGAPCGIIICAYQDTMSSPSTAWETPWETSG